MDVLRESMASAVRWSTAVCSRSSVLVVVIRPVDWSIAKLGSDDASSDVDDCYMTPRFLYRFTTAVRPVCVWACVCRFVCVRITIFTAPLYPLKDFKALYKYCIIIIFIITK